MRTSLAAVLVASAVLAAPARAVVPAKTIPASKASGADPAKWDPEKERNKPSDWWFVGLGDDSTRYVAYDAPNAASDPNYAPSKEGNTPAKAGSAKPFRYSLPLFKPGKAINAGSNVYSVPLEASPYRLEIGKAFRVVCAKGAAGCTAPAIKDSPLKLSDDDTALAGVKTTAAGVTLKMLPPGAKKDGPSAETKDADTLGDWEDIAFKSIAAPVGNEGKDLKTNASKRVYLQAKLKAYQDANKAADAKALGASEIAFLQGRLGDDAKSYDFVWGSGASNPEAAKFNARWRGFILKDVDTYFQQGDGIKPGYKGSTSALNAARRDQLNSADAPKGELEQRLFKMNPSMTRRAGAERTVIAAYLEQNKGKNTPAGKIYAAMMKDEKSRTPDDVKALTGAYDKLGTLARTEMAKQLGGAQTVLAGVDKNTLLDAYCDPSKINSGAVNAGPKTTGALQQGQAILKSSGKGGATTEEVASNAGGMDGSSTAGSANDQCSARFKELRTKFQDQQTGPLGSLKGGLDGREPGTDGPSKFAKHKDKEVDPGKPLGSNDTEPDAAGDAKTGDHVKQGVLVGGFLGMLGMISGGPVGMLLMGAIGFGIGFGLDKLTNT